METLQSRKKVYGMILLFTLTYMVSYMTRINYGAVLIEMVASTGLSKTALSMSLTGSFIAYGAGQVLSGICGDKFRPKILVFIGLILSSAMNTILPFFKDPYILLAVWCVNGLAQSFLWPPIVRLMTALFSTDDYKKASVMVSWGSSFGTIIIYLISPLLITLWHWKAVFWLCAGCGVVMAIVWFFLCPDLPPEPKRQTTEKKKNSFFSPMFFLIMTAVVLQGSLRDGITTWLPTYVSETYHLSSSVSILTGVVLPLFSILTFQLASMLYRKKLKNPITCSLVFFGTGAVAALILYFVTGKSAVASVALSAVLTGCMHGVNLLLISMIPPYYKKYGNVSTVSGVLNSCTYIGSAVSTYGIALLAENYDWKFTLLVWFLIALAGAVVCVICAPVWKKKQAENE